MLIPLLLISGTHERKYLPLTPELHEAVDRVNRTWNSKIKYVSDMDHYGIPEKWSYPTDGKGDCEDYAIAKKTDLEKLGIKSYFVFCRTPKGKGHFVLQVFTERGALVLCNMHTDIRYASDFIRRGFVWIKVQFDDGWYSYETGEKVKPPRRRIDFIKDKE